MAYRDHAIHNEHILPISLDRMSSNHFQVYTEDGKMSTLPKIIIGFPQNIDETRDTNRIKLRECDRVSRICRSTLPVIRIVSVDIIL